VQVKRLDKRISLLARRNHKKGGDMEKTDAVRLGSVQKTLLLPLWGRAKETQKHTPLLIDKTAVEVTEALNYDFNLMSEHIGKFVQYGWIARSLYFDSKVKSFIQQFPEATIVNIGCGLDTTFFRVDNGSIQWIDLDLPDVIALRREYIPETIRNRSVAKSVTDKSWYESIDRKNHVMLLIAGVLYYFDEDRIKQLFGDFGTFLPGVQIVFDYASKLGIKISNKKVLEDGGMDKSACLVWGINNIYEIEKWGCGIEVIDCIPMYKHHKWHFPLMYRIAMKICDITKIMSFAHVRIHGRGN
jgi:O-methyltransferase involved in polyketide biosynthesis